MTTATIDYGIDLGTTNSAIAHLRGTEVFVFKNNEGREHTPSAVYMDKKERLVVGDGARDRLGHDPDNCYSEFKLQMGSGTEYRFERNGLVMKPEELSAEVLKNLKGHAKQHDGSEIEAAVITVPAAFRLPQCEATQAAAQLAGFKSSPLLQEPVAAALAYGFQSESDKVFWLVYDMGGGTFDAAVIQVRDGVLQVANHDGDPHLGGKLIDWELVDQLLIPELKRQYKLSDFSRGNAKWNSPVAKLKRAAEQAKIQLSRASYATVLVEQLCDDDNGELIDFECELQRKDVERIADPFIERTINISRKVLSDAKLGVGDIAKVVLVGGPTLAPYLRERLADEKAGLGIPLEHSADPLTVVAEGAAVFAGTQRFEPSGKTAERGDATIDLEYKPVGADPEPLVGGRVSLNDGRSPEGCTIEFINSDAKPSWRSGLLRLGADGTFVTNLWAEKGRPNTFAIELLDSTGSKIPALPDELTYTVGLTITDPPLINSVGIALANNDVRFFFEKGQSLPARSRDNSRRTARDVKKGDSGDVIRIPVIEGKNPHRADRNRRIGALTIPADRIPRDIPAGSEIEITIEMNESRLINTKAYLPIIDEDFEDIIDYDKVVADLDRLEEEFQHEQDRLTALWRNSPGDKVPEAETLLRQIEREEMAHQVESALMAAKTDPDAADKADNRLLDFKIAIDKLEDSLAWPTLVAEAESGIENTIAVADEHGDSEDRSRAAALERETRQAIESRDSDLLHRKSQELIALQVSILIQHPGFWVGHLEHLEGLRGTMNDQRRADRLFQQGNQAIQRDDVAGLQAAVRQLVLLLPSEEQESMRAGFGSTVL